MKIILTLITFISLSANENWIKIESINQTQAPKPKSKLDVNLSQIEPVNKIMKHATVVKQIIDATNTTNKKEKQPANDKNWFVLNNEESKYTIPRKRNNFI